MRNYGVTFNIEADGPIYRAVFTTDEDAKAFVDAIAATDGKGPQNKTFRAGPGQKGY